MVGNVLRDFTNTFCPVLLLNVSHLSVCFLCLNCARGGVQSVLVTVCFACVCERVHARIQVTFKAKCDQHSKLALQKIMSSWHL